MLDQALANLTSVYHQAGYLTQSINTGVELCEIGQSERLVAIGRAMVDLIESSVDGPLEVPLEHLRGMAEAHRLSGDLHYFGITQLNIGEFERTRGDAGMALHAANEAIAALNASSASHDMPAARLTRAWALAHRNEMAMAQHEINLALSSTFELVRDEVRLEAAGILFDYGNREQARAILGSLGPIESMPPDLQDHYVTALAGLDLDSGLYDRARGRIESINVNEPHRESGFKAHAMTLRALSAALAGDSDASVLAGAAFEHAHGQGAGRWAIQAEILVATLAGAESLDTVLRSRGDAAAPWVSVLAELFLGDLVSDSLFAKSIVETQVMARPDHWRPALRRALADGRDTPRARAAVLLDLVGEPSDVRPLRTFSKQSKGGSGALAVGRSLARRVADRVRVADLGRVHVQVATRTADGDMIRRKVLALLCFLITRPNMAAARDQVVDALWPDQDPGAASNSLNQTVYFLRRVFEPNYVDDLSPGYLRHETDLIWLDPELVSAESEVCRRAIEDARRSSAWETIDLVSRSYRGRFALDFEYEEWAASYRDNLHAAYLEVIEHAVRDELQAARFDRAIELCRRVLDVDPSCETIERQLLRLYRLTGAHAAAEEQYRHYATVMQDDLGISPPPLDEL
jgi:DNA-binding SARP family transcriptional activator